VPAGVKELNPGGTFHSEAMDKSNRKQPTPASDDTKGKSTAGLQVGATEGGPASGKMIGRVIGGMPDYSHWN